MDQISESVEATALPKSKSEVAPPQSAGASATGAAAAVLESVDVRIGNYRWVICALLFFATTINYIDRQVLGILATDETFKHTIGWSEAQYGYVNTAFQAAYALGLLVVGNLMDRFGTRKGFSLAIVFWSVAAMGHASARRASHWAWARRVTSPRLLRRLPNGFRGKSAPSRPAFLTAARMWAPSRRLWLCRSSLSTTVGNGPSLSPAPWVSSGSPSGS